ncbi:MAG: DNA/RNA nuclease SfsA [Proteobacteria bacterium]|nr:DNA/RNA nuclease SfsA [Pseudomonadota bacterium]
MVSVCHPFPEPLVPGRLVRRYKRFLADVGLDDGTEVVAHCPNSGSLMSCLQKGARVYLSAHDDPARRTKYTWQMIRIGRVWVGINTLIPNHLVALAARKRALPLFDGATAVRREVPYGRNSRVDLVVDLERGDQLYVEVKNVTLVEGDRALFPDAVTTRGLKHLRELIAVSRRQGTKAAMVYVVQRTDAAAFGPAAEIDPEYTRWFYRARAAGVAMVAVQARVSPQRVCLFREIPLLD